jgi:hypothetical protein
MTSRSPIIFSRKKEESIPIPDQELKKKKVRTEEHIFGR